MRRYIYESANWGKFTWDKELISEKMAETNLKAGHLFGRLHDIGIDNQLKTMTDAISDEVVESCSIEGVMLDGAQVRSSVAQHLGLELPQHKPFSHYVDGIVKMMLNATTRYNVPLSFQRLFSWHAALFPNADIANGINVGTFRTSGMKVVSGMPGREKIHYQAPDASQVKSMMEQFINWFNQAETHNYVRSAVAHLYFVSIHPFDDGNGRIARAISDMALSQADNSAMRYFSMSAQISKEKRHYYKILEQTQKGNGDLSEWIAWYLDCMSRAIDTAEHKLNLVLRKAIFWQQHCGIAITERQRTILNIFLDGYEGKLTVKNWAKLAEISPDTAARDVKDLVNKQILSPQAGAQRNVEYDIL